MLILASTIKSCVSISAFASLVCVPVGIAITAGIRKCKSIIKKKEEESW